MMIDQPSPSPSNMWGEPIRHISYEERFAKCCPDGSTLFSRADIPDSEPLGEKKANTQMIESALLADPHVSTEDLIEAVGCTRDLVNRV
jgi:hypothetical protein